MTHEELQVLLNVLQALLENSEDLQPEIVDMVNKHFWELI